MIEPKYKTYAELSAAFKSGELDPACYFLVLDKGGTENHLRWHKEGASDSERDRMNDECRKLFDGGRPDAIEELFAAAGIPCEWC